MKTLTCSEENCGRTFYVNNRLFQEKYSNPDWQVLKCCPECEEIILSPSTPVGKCKSCRLPFPDPTKNRGVCTSCMRKYWMTALHNIKTAEECFGVIQGGLSLSFDYYFSREDRDDLLLEMQDRPQPNDFTRKRELP